MATNRDDEFRIDMAKLPNWIETGALASGGFPYDKKLSGKRYETELRTLQVELVKLLNWTRREGQRIVIVFEGRDAAGKGGAIQRLTAHLNPRSAHVVALSKPSSFEAGQWYFQRYVEHLPTRGEMAIFDRSWYNRAGVERVFDFCTKAETDHFLREVPEFESMLCRDGALVFKFFLEIGKEMQMKRLHQRWRDPLHRWKVSELDEKAIAKWSEYSAAFERMLRETDTPVAPWTVILSNDKRRSRLECIRHLLDALPYAHKDEKAVGKPDRAIAMPAKKFLAMAKP